MIVLWMCATHVPICWNLNEGGLMDPDTPAYGIWFLSHVQFVEYNSIKIKYFPSEIPSTDCFIKSISRLITASGLLHITAQFITFIIYHWGNDVTILTHCDVTMGRWCCTDKITQRAGDVDMYTTNSLYNLLLRYFTQNSG